MITFLPLAVNDQSVQPAPLPWWFWILLALALVVVVWWLWRLGYLSIKAHAQPHVESQPVPAAADAGAQARAAAAPALDDLKIIEGIGPKINAVLHQAGIGTFAQLAEADPAALKRILLDAGLRLAEPQTWPQQAALARDGRMAELRQLQQSLTAGRR